MKNILLIDADSKIPNLALMKLSTGHKQKGDMVDIIKCHLPYYPNKSKNFVNIPNGYDKKYCSIIFEGNRRFIRGDNIIFGGTGIDLETKLPEEIESLECDYSLYPENEFSYGFITRGCIRKCKFCKVPQKEGMIHKVSNIDKIVKHKKVKFLDNNILAYDKHEEIFQELIDKNIKHQFNQGLDIRLITKQNSHLLSQLNYMGEYIFAFDDGRYKNLIENKFCLLDGRNDGQFKFFVYIHPKMNIDETIKRIVWLKENKCLPYIMRDIECFTSKHNKFYTDIASYCNQVNLFKKLEFEEFLDKRHTNGKRIKNSLRIGKENCI